MAGRQEVVVRNAEFDPVLLALARAVALDVASVPDPNQEQTKPKPEILQIR